MTKKLGVIIIFGGITFVFVFMGYNTFGPTTSGYAATVNNSIITLYEHQNISNQMINFYSNMLNDLEMTDTQIRNIRRTALEQLIVDRVVSQSAKSNGLLIVPEMIRDEILKIEAFKTDGVFNRTYYETFLENQRINAFEFEENIERGLLSQMIDDLFQASIARSDAELANLWKLNNTEIDLDFVKINKDILKTNLKVDESELESYISKNKDALKNYYENNEAYRQEHIKASHILLSINEDRNEAQALKVSKEVLQRAQTEDFEELAKEFSDDPGSKDKGGDLGYFKKGAMVKEFEDAAFNMKVGELSEPIKTQFGYHIIKLIDKKSKEPFSKVKYQISRDKYLEEQVIAELDELKEHLKNENLDEVNKFRNRHNLSWENTGLFPLTSDSIPNIGLNPQVMDEAMRLTERKSLSNRLVQDGQDLYILSLKQKKSPSSEYEEDFITSENKRNLDEVFSLFKQELVESSRIYRNLKAI